MSPIAYVACARTQYKTITNKSETRVMAYKTKIVGIDR